MKQICRVCLKEFDTPNKQIKFCSEECSNIYQRLQKQYLRKFYDIGVKLVKLGQDYPYSKPNVVYEKFSGEIYGRENVNENISTES